MSFRDKGNNDQTHATHTTSATNSNVVKKIPLRRMSSHVGESIENEAHIVPKLLLKRTSHTRSVLCTECINKKDVPNEIKRINETSEDGEIKRFIDPDGQTHVHDTSTTNIEYICSNNHRWVIKESKNKCWCLHYQSSPLSSGSYSPRSNKETLTYVSPRRAVYSKGDSFISYPTEKSDSSGSEEILDLQPLDLKDLESKTMRQSPNRTRSSHN